MTQTCEESGSVVLSDCRWVPDEVEALSGGIAVMHTVVTEIPCGLHAEAIAAKEKAKAVEASVPAATPVSETSGTSGSK